MKLKVLTFLLVCVSIFASTDARKQTSKYEPGGPCCLCMCLSIDQNKCAMLCIRLQHGKKVVEEPVINQCTKSCERHGVKKDSTLTGSGGGKL